jgi:ubiquinol-cytochrome c reductase cytochrome c1 subunit
MRRLILSALLAFAASLALGPARAAEDGVHWDKFPTEKLVDMAALQHGAKLFVNYCLNCHAASFMRYNRMRDIGLSEEQIKSNLMFATDRVGDTMNVTLDPKHAKEWFGATPPDLTVMVRSRSDPAKGSGADYVYTYLRSYYRDPTKITGWNNLVFPSVGMPHVLWELQGQRAAVFAEQKDAHDPNKTTLVHTGWQQLTPGRLTTAQYDDNVADLVAFMTWMSEPQINDRVRLGVGVLIFLGLFTWIAWRMNAAYWKDIK